MLILFADCRVDDKILEELRLDKTNRTKMVLRLEAGLPLGIRFYIDCRAAQYRADQIDFLVIIEQLCNPARPLPGYVQG